MPEEHRDDGVHEGHAAYTGTQADVIHIQLDIPCDVWAHLTQWALERQIKESEAVVQIINRQIAPPEDTYISGFYADLIGRHLRDELEPGPRLMDIQIDECIASAVRQELESEYGTDDPVKVIELVRNRE